MCVLKSCSLGLLAVLAAAQQHRLDTEADVVVPKNPYLTNNGQIPPKSQYDGPLFKLSHDWPTHAPGPITDAPWRKAINNQQITPENAGAYVAALKEYVSADARKLFLDPNSMPLPRNGTTSRGWGPFARPFTAPIRPGSSGPAFFPIQA